MHTYIHTYIRHSCPYIHTYIQLQYTQKASPEDELKTKHTCIRTYITLVHTYTHAYTQLQYTQKAPRKQSPEDELKAVLDKQKRKIEGTRSAEDTQPFEAPHRRSDPVPDMKPFEAPHRRSDPVPDMKPFEAPHRRSDPVPDMKPFEAPHRRSDPVPDMKPFEGPHKRSDPNMQDVKPLETPGMLCARHEWAGAGGVLCVYLCTNTGVLCGMICSKKYRYVVCEACMGRHRKCVVCVCV